MKGKGPPSSKKVLPGIFHGLPCNLCGHLWYHMPDIENSRKAAKKRCRVGPGQRAGNTAERQPENSRNSQNSCFSGVSAVLPAVFRLFARDPLGTFFCLFSMLGIGHLCRWPQRLQGLPPLCSHPKDPSSSRLLTH